MLRPSLSVERNGIGYVMFSLLRSVMFNFFLPNLLFFCKYEKFALSSDRIHSDSEEMTINSFYFFLCSMEGQVDKPDNLLKE